MAYPQHFPYGIGDDAPVTLTRDDGTPVTVHFHPPEQCPDCEWQRAIDSLADERWAEERHALFEDSGGVHGPFTFRPPSEAVTEPYTDRLDTSSETASGADD